jgi:hypothetical protein
MEPPSGGSSMSRLPSIQNLLKQASEQQMRLTTGRRVGGPAAAETGIASVACLVAAPSAHSAFSRAAVNVWRWAGGDMPPSKQRRKDPRIIRFPGTARQLLIWWGVEVHRN